MDKEKFSKVLRAIVRVIEVIIGFICGTEITTFFGI